MAVADFIIETRKWLKGFNLFKRNKRRNRITPFNRCTSYDRSTESESSCFCNFSEDSSTCSCQRDDFSDAVGSSDSAFESARSSPQFNVLHTSIYFNVSNYEDISSITTEYTIVDDLNDEDESEQNIFNEKIESVNAI